MNRERNPLSPREGEVLCLVAQGLTSKEIARLLEPPVSEWTVKEHLRRIYVQIGVSNRVEATNWWSGNGSGRSQTASGTEG